MRGLLFLIFFSGCGYANLNYTERVIDKALLPYVENWEKESGLRVRFPVLINNKLQRQVGVCSYHYEMSPLLGQITIYDKVEIQMKYFDYMLTRDRQMGIEQVLNHELEHCVKGRLIHNSNLLTDGCPSSIMYPYSFGDSSCYSEHRARYWDEVRNAK